VVAFANSDGGVIAPGFKDADKAQGRDRVRGIQENLMNWDELRRPMLSRITAVLKGETTSARRAAGLQSLLRRTGFIPSPWLFQGNGMNSV
jgi:hypothetical protein